MFLFPLRIAHSMNAILRAEINNTKGKVSGIIIVACLGQVVADRSAATLVRGMVLYILNPPYRTLTGRVKDWASKQPRRRHGAARGGDGEEIRGRRPDPCHQKLPSCFHFQPGDPCRASFLLEALHSLHPCLYEHSIYGRTLPWVSALRTDHAHGHCKMDETDLHNEVHNLVLGQLSHSSPN